MAVKRIAADNAVGGGVMNQITETGTAHRRRARAFIPAMLPLILCAICSLAGGAQEVSSSSLLRIQVMDLEHGTPIPGAIVECREFILAGEPIITTATTAADGALTISRSTEVLRAFITRAGAPGYASRHNMWGANPPAESIILKLPRGTKVGGTVRNPASVPVDGAQVTLSGKSWQHEGTALAMEMVSTETGPDGRWSTYVSPDPIADLKASIEHPEHADWWSAARPVPVDALLEQRWEVVLEEGLELRGRITGPDGTVISGAVISYQTGRVRPSTVRSDAEGRFTIPHCSPEGMFAINITAEGFAPAQMEVTPSPSAKPVEITLTRGRPFRIHVVDAAGSPVPGAAVRPARWLDQIKTQAEAGWTGKTGKDGRATWNHAPETEFKWTIAAHGYSQLEFSHTPKSAEHTVTILRPMKIRGSVIDGETGSPVEDFQIVSGIPRTSGTVSWDPYKTPRTGSNGILDLSYEDTPTTRQLLVLSPRHLPYISGVIPVGADEVTTRLALMASPPGEGRVIAPDGTPVSSASVCLSTRWSGVNFDGKGPNVYGPYSVILTDSEGRFSVPPQDTTFTLAVWSDSGYTEQMLASTSAAITLRLEPWATVEGYLPGGKAGEPVRANSVSTSILRFWPQAQVNSEGRFRFPHLRPGDWVFTGGEVKPHWYNETAFGVKVHLEAGEHRALALGDGPGVVTGSVDLTSSDGQTLDAGNDFVKLNAPDKSRTYLSAIAQDGTFRFVGIAEGSYSLTFQSHTMKPAEERRTLAWNQQDVTVPASEKGTSVTLVDVGRLTLVSARIAPGAPAPEIVTVSAEGREIRLSDFRGRWVVVDFWGERCAPCIHAMTDTLKPLWQRRREGGRLVVFSVALTEDRAACNKLIRDRGFDWDHGFAKGDSTGVTSAYRIRGIPALYLIDPEGRTVAADVSESELLKKIDELVK